MIKIKCTLLSVLFLATVFSLGSCNSDDTYLPPNPEIVKMFNKIYPHAQNVEWSQKGSYYVAECYSEGAELDVWFDANGNWLQTETDIFEDDLPASVYTTFSEGNYASWVIEDITQLTYPGNPVLYVIEVQQGGQKHQLTYSGFGGLLHDKDITNADDTLWPDIGVI